MFREDEVNNVPRGRSEQCSARTKSTEYRKDEEYKVPQDKDRRVPQGQRPKSSARTRTEEFRKDKVQLVPQGQSTINSARTKYN